MDAKITKERLSRMLSYDWLKIVGLAVAAIIFWTLIFTTTATRITPAQQFTAINYFGNAGIINTKFADTLNAAKSQGIFSYEVMEVTNVDVGGNAEYGSTLMETRIATYEGDVIFVPDVEDGSFEYEFGGEKVKNSYLQNLVRRYGHTLMNLDLEDSQGYFKRMEKFLNGYYNGDYANGTLDESAVRADFLARIKRNKDKRFKKAEQIEQGVKDEIARIEKYNVALKEFYGYLNSGLVQMTKTTVLDYADGGKVLREGVYSINLCPDREKMPKLHEVAAYVQSETDEAGETHNLLRADNMNIALCNFAEVEESFEFESLLYINYVIRLSKAA